MSVPTNKRKEAALNVFKLANDNMEYFVKATSNTKKFDTQFYSLVIKMQDLAINVATLAWEANCIKVEDENSFQRRIALQQQSIENNSGLLNLVNCCKRIFHIRKPTFDQMCQRTQLLGGVLKKWYSSDVERYTQELSK